MKILHVLDHSVPLHSGYSFRTLAILREQRRLGWETAHVTTSKHYGAVSDEEDVDGFHFFRTRVPAGGWRARSVLNQVSVVTDTSKRLDHVIAATRPDVLHAHSPCLNGIATLQAGRRAKLPVVYEMRASWEDAAVDHGSTTEGSMRYKLSRALETWTLRRAHAITTICQGLRDDILARGIPAERVTVIPNAVNPVAFPVITAADAELKAQLGLEGCFTLGFLGSFYGYEGLDTLLDAVPALVQFEPNVRVLLIGGGPEEERLKAQAHRLGISGRVIFLGRVPHADVARYYSVVDLLVYPRKSVRLTETVTPLKPLESMSQGQLLIASNVGGHRELIDDGVTGRLFAPGDPQALARAVQDVLADRLNWDAMREAGRRFVERERTWRASVIRYTAVYEAALASASTRR